MRSTTAANESVNQPAEPVVSAAQYERTQSARRRVLALGAWVVLLGFGLAVLIVWRRDAVRVEHTTQMAEAYARALSEFVSPGAPWPTTFPPPGSVGGVPGGASMTYVGPQSNVRTADGKQVLAYSSVPLTSFTRPSGRAAVVVEGNNLTVEWLTERLLARQHAPASGVPR